jgi:uncharacterized protein
MPYMIDGHNLIPKLHILLSSIDDEMDLVSRLQEFCRLRRVQVEVFFDGASPGRVSKQKYGAVTAHFIRQASSADAAIEAQLDHLGKTAKNWTVVSSDHRVQRAAAAVHCRVLSSEDFSREMIRAASASRKNVGEPSEISPGELEEWENIFKNQGKK